MADSMFESILGTVTPETTQLMAERMGESPSAVQHGLGAATAATLSGLARNSGEPGFMDRLIRMVGRANGQNTLGSVTSMISAGPSGAAGEFGNRLTGLVFGSQQGEVASLVSQHSGLSGSAGGGIVKMAGALVLGHLARMHAAGSLNPNTLPGTLRTEAAGLANHVPGGFLGSLAGLGGVSGLAGAGRETIDRGETVVRNETVSRGPGYSNVLHAEGPHLPERNRWAVPAIAGLVGAAVLGWIVHRLVGNTAPAVNETARNVITTTPYNAVVVHTTALGQRINISLPDGAHINVPSNGVEARLIRVIQHPDTQGSGVAWIDFDHLLFENNQASLQPQSDGQLDNIAAILKAYPAVKVGLGGYTDNTGDATANRLLSEQRADNVMTALVQRGIDPTRLSAHGYGDENPVADNSTLAGRQKNSRIAIRVASK